MSLNGVYRDSVEYRFYVTKKVELGKYPLEFMNRFTNIYTQN